MKPHRATGFTLVELLVVITIINSNASGAAAMYSNAVNQDIRTAHAWPLSVHAGGVNVAFCDEHVAFLRQDIDPGVFTQLCAPYDVGAAAGSSIPPPPLNDSSYSN